MTQTTIEQFNPAELTVQQARRLKGRELMAAVAWWVFGDDLQDTGKAVEAWVPPERWHDEIWMAYSCPFALSRDRAMYVWSDRGGKPWQSDLESHVANWRADPPDGTAELAESMFDEGMPLEGYLYRSVEGDHRILNPYDPIEGAVLFSMPRVADGRTFREAVFRAAVVVAIQEKGR